MQEDKELLMQQISMLIYYWAKLSILCKYIISNMDHSLQDKLLYMAMMSEINREHIT